MADTASKNNSLNPGRSGLAPGQTLWSDDGRFFLTMQTDGNLVLQDQKTGKILFATNTYGKGGSPWLQLDGEGNISVYTENPNLAQLWTAKANNKGGTQLIMQKDGNLVLYKQDGRTPVWATGTNIVGGGGFQVPSIKDIGNDALTGVKIVTGVSSTEAAIRAAVGAFKAKGDVGKNILGGIAGSVVVGIVAPVKDTLQTSAVVKSNTVNPKVARFAGAYQNAAIEDPANSLKVDVGIVGVVAGVVTVNPVAIAGGAASIAIGAVGLAEDAQNDLAKADAAKAAGQKAAAPAPLPAPDATSNPPAPAAVPDTAAPPAAGGALGNNAKAAQAVSAGKKVQPIKTPWYRRVEAWIAKDL